MLIIGYCFGIRSERKLCEEVRLHLAYRWFCRLDLNDAVPHHLTFSENRLNRFRESDILRHIFERVVIAAMEMGLVKGEGFAVDASVMDLSLGRDCLKTIASSSPRESSCQARLYCAQFNDCLGQGERHV